MTVTLASLKCVFLLHGKCSLLLTIKKTLPCIIHISNIQKEYMQHCKNRIVKKANLLVSTVARNSGNCNLIGSVGCYDCMHSHGNIYTCIII